MITIGVFLILSLLINVFSYIISMEIPTVNKLTDKYDWKTYTRLLNAELLKDDKTHLVLLIGGYKKLRVCKSNLLRVLYPQGSFIKKWILS